MNPEYGPGLNGWPAHGYSDMRYAKVVCYCGADFSSKMALNQHVETEIIFAEHARIEEGIRKLWSHEWPDDFDARVAIMSYNAALGAALKVFVVDRHDP